MGGSVACSLGGTGLLTGTVQGGSKAKSTDVQDVYDRLDAILAQPVLKKYLIVIRLL